MEKLIPLTYGIDCYDDGYGWTTVEAARFSEDLKCPIAWAVRKGSRCMSKETGHFDYEPMSSHRTEDFLKEHRFDTIEEAVACFEKFQPCKHLHQKWEGKPIRRICQDCGAIISEQTNDEHGLLSDTTE